MRQVRWVRLVHCVRSGARRSSAVLLGGAALVVCLGVAACAGTPGTPEIRVRAAAGTTPAIVEVVGVPSDILGSLRSRTLSPAQWSAVLRVAVAEDQPAMLGEYSLTDRGIRFTPSFPLDPGREYVVTFAPAAVPGTAADGGPNVVARVGLPAVERDPTTVVTHLYPSADVVPENQLRLYVHFSAPMGLKGGLDFITLVDETGREIVDPFLPLDAEFWNGDRTRYTVFFDPGRQKRGILPNQQMGRSLEIGKRYAIVVSRDWLDGNGLPLKAEFRKSFAVGPADERPIDVKSWQVAAPRAGTREPIVVTFPEPLDHGLLSRALGVTGADGGFLEGDVAIDERETRWTFTPRTPWSAATYQLTALAMLEDLAGNRIGRPFEVDQFERADRPAEVERTLVPVVITAHP